MNKENNSKKEKVKFKLNLPNKLTFFRILMVPVFFILMIILKDNDTTRIICAVIYALTCITDMLDGKIARKYDLITDFGKFLDPLADKFIVIAALLGFLEKYNYLKFYVFAVAIVIFRELAVTSLRLIAANKNVVIAADKLGKIKTVTQMTFIVIFLLEPVIFKGHLFSEIHILSYVFMTLMAIMTLISGIDYFVKYGDLLLTDANAK